MKVEFSQKFLLQGHFGVVLAEQESVRQNYRSPTVLFQPLHDQSHEKVGSFAALEFFGEVVLDGLVLVATIGRIHKDHVKGVPLGIVQQVPAQGIAVFHPGPIHIVEQQIGDAEHIGEGLFFHPIDRPGILFLVFHRPDLFLQFLEPAGQKSPGAAGQVSKVSVFDTIER